MLKILYKYFEKNSIYLTAIFYIDSMHYEKMACSVYSDLVV